MKRIGILSDTHGTFDAPLRDFFADVDELWHAGDFGGVETADAIAAFKPLRGVYGNIDGGAVRLAYPRWQLFDCEEVRVAMTHIGGYPGHYDAGIRTLLYDERPQLFVCGHSHILKVMFDKTLGCLHINPGAAGKYGFHKVRTAIRFVIEKGKMKDLEVLELEKK